MLAYNEVANKKREMLKLVNIVYLLTFWENIADVMHKTMALLLTTFEDRPTPEVLCLPVLFYLKQQPYENYNPERLQVKTKFDLK